MFNIQRIQPTIQFDLDREVLHLAQERSIVMTLLQQYKHWVRRNSNLLGAVEGALSSLIWFLPDRFSDSELSSEALQSLLGLLALYHESVLQEPASALGQKQPVPWQMWLGALQQVGAELLSVLRY